MMMPDLFMVFDVESVGLHGEGFAYGFVVVDRSGKLIASGSASCSPDEAKGGISGREWVMANVPRAVFHGAYHAPAEVRDAFWSAWQEWKGKGAVLVADCAWPVEARFLAACVNDAPGGRDWEGPYPLHDLASIRLAAGLDPLGTADRLPDEMPIHDPLADARQSARLLIEALSASQAATPLFG